MDGEQLLNQELQEISELEVKAAIKTMKSGNAAGCDDLPVEMVSRQGSGQPYHEHMGKRC